MSTLLCADRPLRGLVPPPLYLLGPGSCLQLGDWVVGPEEASLLAPLSCSQKLLCSQSNGLGVLWVCHAGDLGSKSGLVPPSCGRSLPLRVPGGLVSSCLCQLLPPNPTLVVRTMVTAKGSPALAPLLLFSSKLKLPIKGQAPLHPTPWSPQNLAVDGFQECLS